ncbi:LysM domain-containing protein [Amycolatopsis xylanica]|uniref:LysM domain-containing protein n=1 Tax=Amycolatopsis xylanica TaxID=589385 RepID=A0A1H2U8E4_9PSEU|nr:LysM peptidoglycan-binding domain-containing protein [Amycolatopsis xylanica]SDW52421.1 LysM domain-containing protein [Amycolatopsis xylanica]
MLPKNTPAMPVGNELAKALLIDTTTGVGHSVMYNPEELKLDQGNVFAEVGIPGLDAPPVQYVRGKPRVLTMELFFDTYEIPADVREHTEPIVRLLDKRQQTHAPPVLLFLFGRMQFRCVLVEAGQRFTLFVRDGTPVRSTMTVRLQEYVEARIEIKQGVFFGSPTVSAVVNAVGDAVVSGPSTVHVTVAGDTLSGLAAAYLGDAGRWRQIAEANQVEDPTHLPPGRSLVIPGGRP